MTAAIRIFVGCDPHPDKAYVYAILIDGVARYIGKGSGILLKRAKEHMRTVRRVARRRACGEKVWTQAFHHRLLKAWEAGAEIEEVVVRSGLSHDDAFAFEVSEIARLSHSLWNGDKGGLGVGRTTEVTRAKQRESAKRRFERPGERERLLELSRQADTLENRERARKLLLERSSDPEHKAMLLREARRRWSDPDVAARMLAGLDKGRRSKHTPERMKKVWADPRTREKASQSHKAAWVRRKAAAI